MNDLKDGILVSVVVPVFDEEENIQPLYRRLMEVVEEHLAEVAIEIIFVNDGSSDHSWDHIKALAAADHRVRGIDLSRNFGHQAALTAGLQRAQGDVVISMDGDFQDPPELLPRLLDKWREGARVVYARRVARSDRLLKKITASIFYRLLSRFSDIAIPGQVGDFRLMDRSVLKSLLRLDEHDRYLRGMVAWLGHDHAFVDYERPARLPTARPTTLCGK